MTGSAGDSATVDHDLCVGVAQCVGVAPHAFQLDDDGLSTFIGGAQASGDELALAADLCPASAITVHRGASPQ